MDLRWTERENAFRAEARSWLVEHLAAWHDRHGGADAVRSGDTRVGFAQHLDWERDLHAGGWAAVSWPERYGGRGASLWEWLILEEEYYRAGCPPRVTQNGIFLLAPTVFEFGSQPQQDHVLPRMAAAEDLWCQGWSEPNAGSDLAGIRALAVRTDGGWVLNGQKTWTTRGAFCTHLFGLFRTDPEAERHRGLSYLLVPLTGPGVTVRGFGRLDGDEGFAEVFFEDAFLADDAVPGGVVLGEVGQGWSVAMATTGSERGLTLRSPGRFLATAERLIELYWQRESRAGADARASTAVSAAGAGRADHAEQVNARTSRSNSSSLRDRVVDGWMRAEAYSLFTLDTVTRLVGGATMGAESSVNKIWWSELDCDLHQIALDLLGPDAELEGAWSKGWQFALSGPIYAGTNEIQRNIAAERVLGLPRR
ncbi:MAG: acyl-CoA dehydrogenase family protein [Acidimicrobiales bacterium]